MLPHQPFKRPRITPPQCGEIEVFVHQFTQSVPSTQNRASILVSLGGKWVSGNASEFGNLLGGNE
jgi:hypothetical protein